MSRARSRSSTEDVSSVRQMANSVQALTGEDPLLRVEQLPRGRKRYVFTDGAAFDSPHLAEEHLRAVLRELEN